MKTVLTIAGLALSSLVLATPECPKKVSLNLETKITKFDFSQPPHPRDPAPAPIGIATNLTIPLVGNASTELDGGPSKAILCSGFAEIETREGLYKGETVRIDVHYSLSGAEKNLWLALSKTQSGQTPSLTSTTELSSKVKEDTLPDSLSLNFDRGLTKQSIQVTQISLEKI